MEMPSKTLVLLFSPTGSGKNTRIEERYADARHINRDGITGKLLESHDIDFHSPEGAVQDRISEILREEGLPAYYRELDRLLQAGRPLLVVDYPPGGKSCNWAVETIERAKRMGYGVILEGLHVDPVVGLHRALTRNAADIPQDRFADFITASQYVFHSWVETYQKFPEQFMEVAGLADRASLLDNRGNRLSAIAVWQNGQPDIADEQSYAAFLGNERLNPQAATFSAERPSPNAPVEMTIRDIYKPKTVVPILQRTEPS